MSLLSKILESIVLIWIIEYKILIQQKRFIIKDLSYSLLLK